VPCIDIPSGTPHPDGSLYGLLHEWKAVVEKIKAFPELPEEKSTSTGRPLS
jgi:hypothetical protein